MSISYGGQITLIQNGQAITAENLNAPSVDLELRTQEIKRSSDYNNFSSAHTVDSRVVLTTDPNNTAEPSITVRSRLKQDGSANSNLIKYYLPELNNLNFNVYSNAVHGSRYIVPGAAIGSILGDSNGSESNSVLSTALTVPGDGFFAKIPLRYTPEGDSPGLNYPDEVYPKTRAQSLGVEYFSSAPQVDIVKLPQRSVMDLAATSGSTESSSEFVQRLNAEFVGYTFTLDSSTGALSVTDAGGSSVSARIGGTREGAGFTITHVLDREQGSPGIRLIFSAATSSLYTEHDSRISSLDLAVVIFEGANQLASASSPVAPSVYGEGYHILPEKLDPSFAYIPLIRLTFNSLLVANMEIPLGTRTLPNGEVINSLGDPASGLSGFNEEQIHEYNLNFNDQRFSLGYKGSYTVDLGSHTVNSGELSNVGASSSLPDILYIRKNLSQGDRVTPLEIKVSVTDSITTASASPTWQIIASIITNFDTISSSATLNSAPSVGDRISLLFDSSLLVNQPEVSSLEIYVELSDGTQELLTGGLCAVAELQVI